MTKTVEERLSALAMRDPIAKLALDMHRAGAPLVDCLIDAAEALSGQLTEARKRELDSLIEHAPTPVIMSEAKPWDLKPNDGHQNPDIQHCPPRRW